MKQKEGYLLKEIAPMLEISYQTIKNWLSRNRSKYNDSYLDSKLEEIDNQLSSMGPIVEKPRPKFIWDGTEQSIDVLNPEKEQIGFINLPSDIDYIYSLVWTKVINESEGADHATLINEVIRFVSRNFNFPITDKSFDPERPNLSYSIGFTISNEGAERLIQQYLDSQMIYFDPGNDRYYPQHSGSWYEFQGFPTLLDDCCNCPLCYVAPEPESIPNSDKWT